MPERGHSDRSGNALPLLQVESSDGRSRRQVLYLALRLAEDGKVNQDIGRFEIVRAESSSEHERHLEAIHLPRAKALPLAPHFLHGILAEVVGDEFRL